MCSPRSRRANRVAVRPMTVLLALLSLAWLTGCMSQPVAPAAPAAAPTFTPTVTIPEATPAPVFNSAALIDELGRDIAERRVIDVYQRVEPAVVNITTQVLRRGFFFEAIPEEGAGSGFVIDADGHVLTNYHVIEGAQRVEVSFSDATVVQAEVVGADPRYDIALLRVNVPAEKLTPVELGDSENLQVGQRAIAIGNPFGQFGSTLTTGVISALERTLEGPDNRTITGVIQTDAAINRGNSGGPLLDSNGRVIGINTAIFSPTGTSAGVGFAVPVSTIKRLLPDLFAFGRYRHPWLGLRYAYPITPGLAEILKLPVDHGLLVVQLFRDSPLDQAQVRGAQSETILGNQRVYLGGDILLSIDSQEVRRLEQLETLVGDKYQVGDVITVQLLRGSEPYEIQVELVEEPFAP